MVYVAVSAAAAHVAAVDDAVIVVVVVVVVPFVVNAITVVGFVSIWSLLL